MILIKSTEKNRHLIGRFVKGVSGNPKGRPRGSTGHNAELRRVEEDTITLATNAADVIAETTRLALDEVGRLELAPLFDAICESVKDAVKEGRIGPSAVAVLRAGFDTLQESGHDPSFFAHANLPRECTWQVFKGHYTTRGRVDYARHATDVSTFPPIARRINALKSQRLMPPVDESPPNKLENGFD